jgi:Mg-chelatase subunit ChlD
VTEAGKRTTSRRDLSRHENFEQISPEVGELDELAVDEAMQNSPDEMLGLLADLTGATDPKLRDLARKLAGRLMLELGNRGRARPRGIGKMVEQPYTPEGGDIDIDASLEALAEVRSGLVVDSDRLRVRGWRKPGTAFCLMLDRSGSMGGQPLATSAVATASIASRNPDDYSVIAFGKDVVVTKSQDVPKSSERVINDVLTLRGHGTTDLAGALIVAQQQLARSRAGRRIGILLSDCRATVEGDAEAAARGMDELIVIAPSEDHEEARAFADRVGARLALVGGPSEIPSVLSQVLEQQA